MVQMWKDELNGDRQKTIVIDEELGGVRLHGELGSLINGRQILFRCVKEPKRKRPCKNLDKALCSHRHFQEHGMETRFCSLDKKFISLQPLPGAALPAELLPI